MILLRTFEGVGALEWRLAQKGWTAENQEWAEDLSEELFGITEEDTRPWIDEDGKAWLGGVEIASLDDFKRKSEEWEKHFAPLRMFRDEADAYWASVGWDVTDGLGKQLEVMRELGRPLICAVLGLHVDAKLPQGDDPEAWGAALAEEARRFKPRR